MPTDSSDRRSPGAVWTSAPTRSAEPGRAIRSFDTAELFGPDAEIEITHKDAVYRLKITRAGKLILNK